MRPKTALAIAVLFFLNAFSASFATIPTQSDAELFFPETSETSARNSSCGTNSTLTDLMVWTDATSYTQGASPAAYFAVNCSVNGDFYELTVTTSGPGWQNGDYWNWTESNAYESFNTTWNNLSAGTYCINATLYHLPSGGSWQVADSEYQCFTVTSTTGGGGGSTTYVPNGSLSIYGVSSNYSSGSNVTAFFDYTSLDVGVTYGEMWYLTDANGNVVQGYGVNQTWNATASYTNSTETLGNLANGTYCITATLYTVYSNGTAIILDTVTTCFTIGSTTPTTGCGYDWSLASLSVYPNDIAFVPGEDHNVSIYSQCNLYDENMVIIYNVTDTSSGQTLSYGSWQWVPTSTSDTHYFENLNLVTGVYHVQIGLYHYNGAATYTMLDSVNYNFTVAQTPAVNETLDIDLNGLNYTTGQSVVATLEAFGLQTYSNYTVTWNLLEGTTLIDSGNYSIDTFTLNESIEQVVFTAGTNGTYCLFAKLFDVNGNMVDNDDTCFSVGSTTPPNNGGGGNGSTDAGSSANNPVMPVFNCSNIAWNLTTNITINDCWNMTDAFWFEFNQSGSIVWIDPVVAVGYDYVVYSGHLMTSVTVPTGYGDDVFDLYLWDGTAWYDSNTDLYGGYTHTFATPLDRMSIRGIEAYEMLDPTDPTVFVTGLTFSTAGTVVMIMDPITENYTMQGCGYDPAYTDLMIWTDLQAYMQGATTYADYYVNCSVNTKDYELHVFAYSASGSSWSDYDVWNWTETDSYEMMDDDWTNLAPGTYCINATLYMVSGGAYQFVDFEFTCFTVTANNNGGGNNGTLDPCGLNSSYTTIMSWSDAQSYNYGDSQNLSFYVNCTRIGDSYTLEYHVYDITDPANYVVAGSYSWLATITYQSWNDFVIGLTPGDYCVLTNLYQAGTYLTDDGGITTCFTVVGTTVNSPPLLVQTYQALVAYAEDPLDCYANGMVFMDADNDPDNSNIEWYVNGNSVASGVQAILPSGSVSLGDTLYCEATAHDGITSGNTLQRHYYVVPSNNTAPTVTDVTISPSSPEETDPLTCTYTYNDADNDPDQSMIIWSINGVATTTQGSTLTTGYAAGDFVTCSVTAFDGTAMGLTATGTVLVFTPGSGGNSTPTIGVLGTLAVLSVAFLLVSRKELEE